MTPTEIDAIAGHITVGVIRQYLARREDGLTTDAIQLGTVTRRHFKLAVEHYKLNDSDQTESHKPIAFGLPTTHGRSQEARRRLARQSCQIVRNAVAQVGGTLR
jgi:5-carboxymethyl-2-hydroxymuconate isomerase